MLSALVTVPSAFRGPRAAKRSQHFSVVQSAFTRGGLRSIRSSAASARARSGLEALEQVIDYVLLARLAERKAVHRERVAERIEPVWLPAQPQ